MVQLLDAMPKLGMIWRQQDAKRRRERGRVLQRSKHFPGEAGLGLDRPGARPVQQHTPEFGTFALVATCSKCEFKILKITS